MITIKEIRESSMKARVAGSKRVHHSELVKDMDRDAMIDYMMKDRNSSNWIPMSH